MAVGSFNIAYNQTSVYLAKPGDTGFASGGTNAPEHHLNSAPFTIGGTSSSSTFKGCIDEVAIFNRELSVEELEAIQTSMSVPGTSVSLTSAVSRETHGSAGHFGLQKRAERNSLDTSLHGLAAVRPKIAFT